MQDYEHLIKNVPLDQMDPSQAFVVLQHILSPKITEPIKLEYLDLAVRCRHFKKAIILMNKGVISSNIVNRIFFLLKSVSELDDTFYYFLSFCLLYMNDSNNFDFSEISEQISLFSEKNLDQSILLLISFLYSNPDYDIQQLSSIKFSQEYQKCYTAIIESFQNEESILPYEFIKKKIELMIKECSENSNSNIVDAYYSLESDEFYNKINSLTDNLLKTVKTMPKNLKENSIAEFKNHFETDVKKLENSMKKLIPNSRIIRTSTTKAKAIEEKIDRLSSELKSVKEIILDPFLANSNEETANQILSKLKADILTWSTDSKAKMEFTSSCPTFLYMCSSISLLNLYVKSLHSHNDTNASKAISKLKLLNTSIENISVRLKTGIKSYRNSIERTLEFWDAINDKDKRFNQMVVNACDAMLLWVHYSECALLSGIIREEAVLYAEKSSFYPEHSKDIFTKIIKNQKKDRYRNNRNLREDLYQTVSSRYTSFIKNLKSIPGMRIDTTYGNFHTDLRYPWPRFHAEGCVQFPQDPTEVRNLLKMRMDLYELTDHYVQSLDTPLCMNCNRALACVVCPKCKKLVLCNACKDKLKKCPIEGCVYVFE